MASSVDFSGYYYKWGSIRYNWLEFGRKNRRIKQIDKYLCTFFSKPGYSPFLKAVLFDESTQLVLRYVDYNKAKTELEEIIDMKLPQIGNTRLMPSNSAVYPVTIRNVKELKSVLSDIREQNESLRDRQESEAMEKLEKVREHLRKNPGKYFLVIDVEMYEHDHSLITEIGFVVFQRNRCEKAEYFHFIIDENQQYVNKDHVPDNRHGFLFGKSIVASLEEAKTALVQQVNRVCAIVGHALEEDKKILEGVSLFGKIFIDTQELAFAKIQPKRMSLKHILEELNIPYDIKHLHNAGNDCHYTMKAFHELTKEYDED